ncbi:MAG: hypothetical protein QF809_01585 [Candidatus Peribacteraceae bacterium]|nr:hypothetical protein [Candidatus Peribacteraceae bacterium]
MSCLWETSFVTNTAKMNKAEMLWILARAFEKPTGVMSPYPVEVAVIIE